ncbi:MAG: VCBS repeat-containing protein [Opitutaceae bacterium]|nr:VCBS repeat-containing protein [Opitutaceae bacterium]
MKNAYAVTIFGFWATALVTPSFGVPVSAPTLRTTLAASWDENWFGSVAVYDLNNDGAMEIIAGRHSVLYVWDNKGRRLWRAPVGENSSSPNDHGSSRQYAAPVVGDFDDDGNGEIAIAYSNKVAVYDHTGMILPGWPQTFPGSAGEIRSIAGVDLDHDNRVEILAVKTSSGPVTVAWDITGKVIPGWPQLQGYDGGNDFGGYNQNIGAADLDGDSLPEVVSTYDICHIGIMHADGAPFPANPMFSSAGLWASSVPMFHRLDLAKQGWGPDNNDRDEFTDSPPCFGDIDGDGLPEVILYSDHERAGEYINRGNSLWILNPDMTRVQGFETPLNSGMPLYTGYENNIVQVAPAPAVANIAGDMRPEIVVPSYDGNMRCFSPDGSTLWTYTFDNGASAFVGASGAVIGDLNADAIPEIVFTTYSVAQNASHLIILDGNGVQLHKIPLAKRGSMSPPVLADIDGDHRVEIILSLKDVLGGGAGGVQIWDVASASDNLLPWPTGRGNNLRNGQGTDALPPSVPTNLIGTASSSTAITLAWAASADDVDVTGYRIYRDGALIGTSSTPGYSDTDLTPGTTYTYRVTAFDAAGNESPPSAPALVVAHDEVFTTYAAWRAGSFSGPDLTNSAISGPLADPDGAGLTNLERFAFGLPARGRVASPVTVSTVPSAGQNYLALTFPRKGYSPGLQYVVQSSTDLVTWTDLQTIPPGYPKTVTVRDLVPVSGATRRFLRLRVTAP